MGEQATSEESDPVKVDRSGPNPPSAHTDRAPEDADGGYFKDTVTVSYTDNGDPDLPDGSPGSGVASVSGTRPSTPRAPTPTRARRPTSSATSPSPPRARSRSTPPTRASRSPAARRRCLARDSSHSVDVSAADGESGLVSDPSGETPLDTSTAGEHTLRIEVADKVGHTKRELHLHGQLASHRPRRPAGRLEPQPGRLRADLGCLHRPRLKPRPLCPAAQGLRRRRRLVGRRHDRRELPLLRVHLLREGGRGHLALPGDRGGRDGRAGDLG